MKKISTLACLASVMTLSAPAMAAWEGNWLLGASVGYVDASMDATASISFPQPNNNFFRDIVQKHDDSGILWGVLAGYQARCNHWLFGLELSVDWHDIDEAKSFQYTLTTPGNVVQSTSGSFVYDQGAVTALSMRAGYEFTDYFMPYIRLGVETSDDDLRFSTTTNPAAGQTAVIEGSERSVRFLGGVGAEMPIPAVAGLAARIEYNYHAKGKVVEARGFATDNGTFLTAGGKPHAHSGKFSLVYNFM